MQKIKFITDSACDLTADMIKDSNITVVNIPIAIDGKGYYECKDFTKSEFYDMLNNAKELPVTSHISSYTFMQEYLNSYKKGYTNIIHVTICGTGSSMFSSANMAKIMFFEEYPEAKGKIEIDILDSKAYTYGYGYPIIIGSEMAKQGKSSKEIISYMLDFFNKVELRFATFSLDVAKKSGRISCAAAFVGDVLGFKPLISIIDGVSHIDAKIRGQKNVIPKLSQICKDTIDDNSPYIVVHGENKSDGEDFAKELEKSIGYKPYGIFYIGASIAVNSGDKMIGIIYLGKKR